MPKRHDGVEPFNTPCYPGDGACAGTSRSGICCAATSKCEKWVSSSTSFYEGGCTPRSLNRSRPEYDPTCTQVGECNVAYMYKTRGYVSNNDTMAELPRIIMDRLMAGSNWCPSTQRCQNTPCPEDFFGCTGVQSGINLEKRRDGVASLNEPCHSRRLCDGSIWCCVTVGTCKPQDGERGVFVGSNKATRVAAVPRASMRATQTTILVAS